MDLGGRGRVIGRGRGRGTGVISPPDLDFETDERESGIPSYSQQIGRPVELPSAGSASQNVVQPSLGRGRGRGRRMFAKGIFEDEPQTAVSAPLRERESPDAVEDSDDEEDFISAFRKLHPTTGSSSQTVKLGSGLGRGTTAARVLNQYPVEVGSVIPLRPDLVSPSATSSSSRTSSDEIGSDDFSEIEKSVVVMKGKQGELIHLCANYVRLKVENNQTGIYEYHVNFDPDIESKRLRYSILNKSDEIIGPIFNFDGAKLYLPIKLPKKITPFNKIHPINSDIIVTVTIKYVKKNQLDGCVHFYNVLLRRIMNRILGLAEMHRNFFDYKNVYDLPIHKLEIWPGYVTAVDVYEDGLMLCCDASFKVLRTDTMLDALIRFCSSDPVRGQERFKDYALGQIVLTRYNNKNYKIDDIDWTRTPKSTFVQKRGGREVEISFVDYYKENYDMRIRDLEQPMLVTRGKVTKQSNNFGPAAVILLVPELCHVTGMSEELTSDYRIMKDVAQHTRINPAARHAALIKFVENVNGNPDARKVFKDWGLELESGTVNLQGRLLSTPSILLNKNCEIRPQQRGDFSRDVTKNSIYDPVHVNNWLLVCSQQDEPKARRLIQNYRSVAPMLGISYRQDAQVVHVSRKGSPDDFRRALVDNLIQGVTQFVVVIIPSSRDDLYRVIKIICNREIPIPSQVILSKTLTDERRIRSVMQKVAMQINCKLGGALWTIRIPLPEKIMFIGMDVYHDPKRRNDSVTAVVATLNPMHTKYYSRVIFQSIQQEPISSLRPVFIDMMTAFYEENNAYPDRIVVFRDGVGDGQIEFTKQHEITQITNSFLELDHHPMFTFCIVQKRINARLFLKQGSYFGNPEPGTVMDHTITRRYFFDFFLVSQLIREGTVNPTHYIVLYDNSQIKPDTMQKFAYATSYMYYNWAGSIRVPAMCQYAHKLAGLVGQHLRIEPSKELAKKLYYL